MVYRMVFRVATANPAWSERPPAHGASVLYHNNRGTSSAYKHEWTTDVLPDRPTPTSQRADHHPGPEMSPRTVGRASKVEGCPKSDVTWALGIYLDSTYAIDCPSQKMYKLSNHGPLTSASYKIANRSFIKRALRLDDQGSLEGFKVLVTTFYV